MFTSALGTGLSTLIDANPSFDAMCMFLILITTKAGRIGIAGPSDGGERMQGLPLGQPHSEEMRLHRLIAGARSKKFVLT